MSRTNLTVEEMRRSQRRRRGKAREHARSCSGKVRHQTRGDAVRALREAGGRGGEAEYYRCLNCRHWHLSHGSSSLARTLDALGERKQ